MGEMSRQELLNHIGKISFSMDDLRIFLDTHPDCSEALVRFNQLAKKRDEHIHKFEKLYGPMNFYNNNVCDERWRWVDAPWPWEGEC
ncbi:MAG: spore coat protein CotJB [Lachnospiraceae bacterium]|nr:spore coat protein CotJB [Lachnospiraceae bacterium]